MPRKSMSEAEKKAFVKRMKEAKEAHARVRDSRGEVGRPRRTKSRVSRK